MSLQDDLATAALHHQAGRLNHAALLYQGALSAMPESAELMHLLALVELDQGMTAQAIARLEQSLARKPDAALPHHTLAGALRRTGRTAEARRHDEIAVSLDPDFALAWYSLGRTLGELGHTDAAVNALRQAARANPGLVVARWALAMAGQLAVLPELQALLARADLSPADRTTAQFAVAHLLDQAGRYDEAFAQLEIANAAVREQMDAAGQRFDVAHLREFVDRRIRGCSPSLFGRLQGCGSNTDLPVFVVGMPRSGTTLVEQLLASHSQVRGIGEGPNIAMLVHELERSAIAPDYAAWHPAVCREVAQGYANKLPGLARGARRVVDKTPDNLFHLAAIAVLFPAARVIVCRRDPRDTCLSCYFQNFDHPAPYANDLADCAVRQQEVDRLLAYWRAMLPLRMHEVQYERLVADPETEGRLLVEHLGLEWEPGCLDFHRSRRVVRSASLWQVRRRLYASSVGRWRHYARHIGPLLDAFGRD